MARAITAGMYGTGRAQARPRNRAHLRFLNLYGDVSEISNSALMKMSDHTTIRKILPKGHQVLKTNHRAAGRFCVICAAIAALPLSSVPAKAAGFFLQEQSVAASGRAFAGDAAAAEDPSTIFYNPAGMTQLGGGIQGEANVYLIAPEVNLANQGSTAVGPFFSGPVGGASSGQAFSPQATGDFYVAAPLRHGLWIGLGITTPFALKDNYQLDYFGRYDSTKTELRTVDVAPSAAYAITPWLSIGGGIDFQHADGALQNALPNPYALGSPSGDGLFDSSGSDWALGFNAGILVEPTSDLRVGFSYRSGMDHNLRGASTTEVPGIVSSTQATSAGFKLPDIASLGAAYKLTPALTLLAQADYYGWSRFNEIRFTFADGTQQVVQENFKNTVGFSVGAEWKATEAWTLRSGFEFDPTPTPNNDRSTGLPDSDRTWLAVGVSYAVNHRLAFDVSYAHDFAGTVQVNRSYTFTALSTTVNTNGETTSSTSDVFGLAVRYRY
jgi:long-chain fatty acid transport protein